MERIAILLVAVGFTLACSDGEDPNELPTPDACTIEPAAVTVAPQTLVTFTVGCEGRFELDDDAVARSWSPDGQREALEFTAPELPGAYDVTVYADGHETVRATAIVTVEQEDYDVATDLIWTNDLDNWRVWVGPDGTVVVQNEDGKLTFMDSELNTLYSYDGWTGRTFGDLAWSSDANIVYLLGSFFNFSAGQLLARFERDERVVNRWYETGGTSFTDPWNLEVSPDELLVSYFTGTGATIRELEGDRHIFGVHFDERIQRWVLSGIAYNDPPEGEVFVMESFNSYPSIAFSADGSIAVLSGRYFIDLDSGELRSTEPWEALPICQTYGISERDCPDRNPIVIDNERLIAFGWPGGRPAIFNYVDGTIEVAPAPDGVFLAAEPVLVSYRFADEARTQLVMSATAEQVALDLTTAPISVKWHRPLSTISRRQGDALSADGSWVAVVNYADDSGEIPAENITILDADTGEVIRSRFLGRTSNQYPAAELRWSPTGDRLMAIMGGVPTMFTEDGTPIWEAEPNRAYFNWIGDQLAGVRREPVTRTIQALEFYDQDSNEPTGEELVLDFGTRESRFLSDVFYTNPDGSQVWFLSDAMAEGGMAFDTATGAWDQTITTTPEWASVQFAPTQALGAEPRHVCDTDDASCVLHFVCGGWDPTGRYFVEGWNAGQFDARSSILSFRIVDSTQTVRRDLEVYEFHACNAAAWHPTDLKIAVIDGREVMVVDASNPLGD